MKSLKQRILEEMCIGTMNEEERIVYKLLKEEPKLIAYYGYKKADKIIRKLYHKFKQQQIIDKKHKEVGYKEEVGYKDYRI